MRNLQFEDSEQYGNMHVIIKSVNLNREIEKKKINTVNKFENYSCRVQIWQ